MGSQPTLEQDREAWEVWDKCRSPTKGAKQLGIPISTFECRVKRHKRRIACDAGAPDGFFIKGTSSYFDKEGNLRGQWVKTQRDEARLQEMLKEALQAMRDKVTPIGPVKAPERSSVDLCALYTLSDFHLGMFAHMEEGGAEWNLQIAELGLQKWANAAVDMAPPAHTAIFLQNGDFLHFDGLDPVTPQSRHVLDADSRFQKIVRAGVKGLRYAVQKMLEKHQHVRIIMGDGNHDPSSAVWLRELFGALFENEPRVTVDRTEHPYYCFEWGKTSIFAHHGDKRNIGNISSVVAALYREVWGRTKFSYCHLGHVHHSASKEDSLMHVIVHPTLAAKDAYAARNGYISMRAARTFIYHKQFGEVGSFSITPEMLK